MLYLNLFAVCVTLILLLKVKAITCKGQGSVVQSVEHLTQEPEVPGSMPGPARPHTFVYPSSDSRIRGRINESMWKECEKVSIVFFLTSLSRSSAGLMI